VEPHDHVTDACKADHGHRDAVTFKEAGC
jgi:hypothetical protein